MTTAKPKTPTPQGISALLRKAGYQRAIVAISGGKAGYSVAKSYGDDGAVKVEYYANTGFSSVERRLANLGEYRNAIAAAGYAVEMDTDRERLTVTAKEA